MLKYPVLDEEIEKLLIFYEHQPQIHNTCENKM